MDDYGISLPGGIKPEPNVNATLRVLTIHHDLTDTVKVIYGSWTANILSWLADLVVMQYQRKKTIDCCFINITLL